MALTIDEAIAYCEANRKKIEEMRAKDMIEAYEIILELYWWCKPVLVDANGYTAKRVVETVSDFIVALAEAEKRATEAATTLPEEIQDDTDYMMSCPACSFKFNINTVACFGTTYLCPQCGIQVDIEALLEEEGSLTDDEILALNDAKKDIALDRELSQAEEGFGQFVY